MKTSSWKENSFEKKANDRNVFFGKTSFVRETFEFYGTESFLLVYDPIVQNCFCAVVLRFLNKAIIPLLIIFFHFTPQLTLIQTLIQTPRHQVINCLIIKKTIVRNNLTGMIDNITLTEPCQVALKIDSSESCEQLYSMLKWLILNFVLSFLVTESNGQEPTPVR